jgi:predicted DNA-binding transcriptional regulator AlpA
MKIFYEAAISMQDQIGRQMKTGVKFVKWQENNILIWINGDICHNVAMKTLLKLQI